MITKAVIPAAGLGTRMLPATKSQPKEMLPVGRKPTIQYVIEECVGAGITDILVITGQKKRSIEDHFDEDPALRHVMECKRDGPEELSVLPEGVKLYYTRQTIPTGLADAIRMGRSFVNGEPFVVALGDSIITETGETGDMLRDMIANHDGNGALASIAVEQVPREHVVRYGIVSPKDPGRIRPGDFFEIGDIVEKPSVDEAPSRLAVAARYVFESGIFGLIEETASGVGGEKQISDSIRLGLRRGRRVFCSNMAGRAVRYDIGNFFSFFIAFFDMAVDDPEFGEAFRDYVREWSRR